MLGAVTFQVILHVLKGIFLLRHTSPQKQDVKPGISIVVAARNEAKNLKALIPKLLGQDYPNHELIIVLDRCSDGSLDLLKDLEHKHQKLRTVIVDELPDHFSPKKYALTLGLKAAVNEWILLTDADCRPSSDRWLLSFSSYMTDETDVILGVAPIAQRRGLLNGFIRFETFVTAYDYLSSALLKNPYMGVGRNLAYRKSLFFKVKGYNRFQRILGGDDDLFVHYHAKGSRTRVNITPDANMTSPARCSPGQYWHQKKRHFSVSRFYRPWSKFTHSVKFISAQLVWLSFLILAIVGYQLHWVLGTLSLYLLTKVVINWRVSKKLDVRYPIYLTPLFEVIYVSFVPVVATVATFSKKVKWK